MKQGLLELAVVVGLLLLAAVGAFVLGGDALREWLGLRPSTRAAGAAPRPPPPAAPGREPPVPAHR